MSEGCPKVGMGAINVGEAVTNPVGAGIDLLSSAFKGPSPRYEGGPLISSVQNRLAALATGDPFAIAQTKQDAVTGGAGWKDVATVLAPALRPDLFGQPMRNLTAQEQALVAAAGGAAPRANTIPGLPRPGTGLVAAGAGTSPFVLVTLATVAAALLLKPRRGRR